MPTPTSAQDSSATQASQPVRLVLASGSPRRRYLLHHAGIQFDVQPADIPEERRSGETPESFARRLAREKAHAVASQLPGETGSAVLGSDTIVVLGEDVLGKPRDPEHAVELLTRLRGHPHRVITAVALARAGVIDADSTSIRDFAVSSDVAMRSANEDEIRTYVASGEPLDKAGAYALQGEGRRFVASVEGSETNVIGLPVEETLALLREFGIEPGDS
ncbi:MAG: Maf family protein [Myxococcota bacterium]|nr:Maf family protein [Myxococcota bacterium]